jgi:hypothetical protein
MILIATGLKREARILVGPELRVVAGGGDAARLERELETAAPGAEAVISMGLCGALDADLRPGDWVVADRLVYFPLIPAKAGTQAFSLRAQPATSAPPTPPPTPSPSTWNRTSRPPSRSATACPSP